MEFNPDDNDDDGWEDLPPLSAPTVMEPSIVVEDILPTRLVVEPPRPAPPLTTTTTFHQQATTTTTTTTVATTTDQRSTIVSHPLEHIGSNCVWHLACQVWNCDWEFRGAMAFLAIGVVFRCLLCSFYLYLYPRYSLVMSSVVLAVLVPWMVWNRPAIERGVKKLLQQPSGDADDSFWRDRIQWVEESLTSHQIRVLLVVTMYMIPTLLEMETYQFLVNLVGLSSTVSFAFLLCFGVATQQRWCPLWLLNTGMYLLYGAALWVAFSQKQRRHLPVLASRFCMATAVLLYQRSGSSLSQVIQTALRLTVRDSLTRVGDTVQQDELLQLTMLRWIVDYWSTGTSQQTNLPSTNSTRKRPTQEAPMEWDDLATMLQTTARQMNSEVQSLQTPPSATEVPPEESVEMEASTSSPPNVSMISTSQPQPIPNRASCPSNQASVPPPTLDGSPIAGLQAMFAGMDIDESAKPTIQAYKNVVSTFPPQQKPALCISVLRRLPASLLFCCLLLLGRCSIVEVILLAPFLVLESWRLLLWMRCCQEAAGVDTSWDIRGLVHITDPMVLLLVDEHPSESSLLGVWRNVQSSVSALEVSLTAARAVQTTVVAADFCVNMISLVNFGVEVSQRGWMHGAQILVRELTHLHSTGTPIQSLTHGMSTPGTVTSAAVSAVRNSERMTRNLQTLATEESTGQVLGSLLAAVPLVVGHGWLWGKEGESTMIEPSSESTVRIEELIGEEPTVDELLESSACQEEFQTIRRDEVPAALASGNISEIVVSEDTLDTGARESSDDAEYAPRPIELPVLNVDEYISRDTSSSLRNCPRVHRIIEEDGSDNGDSFEALEDLNLGDCATLSAQNEQCPETIVDEEEEEENLWLKVGGSLAVVGAVIGAVAVTHHNISEGKRREQSQRSGHSS